jgi:sec-independent protein translocase protein TatA
MDLGPAELLIILAVVLVLFGGAKLPQLARSLGAAKREFEEGARSSEDPTPPTDAPPGTA